MTANTIKRGATFTATCTYVPDPDGPANLLGAHITSQMRANGRLVANLTPTIAADGLSFTLDVDGDTRNWPVGECQWDVRIELGGTVFYTGTTTLTIEQSITQAIV